MNILGAYLIFTFLLALLGLVMALNFLRYRFKGDRTLLLLIVFVILFLADVGLTLASLKLDSLNPQLDNFNSGFNYE